MDVELREITAETVRAICELEVAADQRSFVAPNSVSIAGRRAMQQVLEHWRELGVTAARTSVVPSNTGAARLYESLGFQLTGDQDDGELVMTLEM